MPGADLVDRIGPVARGTARPGADAGAWAASAACSISPPAALRDPVLVATTDGVGTKVLLAAEAGANRGVGIDLVAMCVNDLVVQGAQPLFFLDYFATGRARCPASAGEVVAGIGEGCRWRRLRPDRRRDRRDAGPLSVAAISISPGSPSARSSETPGPAAPRPDRRRATSSWGSPPRACTPTASPWFGWCCASRGWAPTACPWEPTAALGEALLAPTRIYVASCLAAIAAGGVKALAHITGGGLVENPPRVLGEGQVMRLDLGALARPAGLRLAGAGRPARAPWSSCAPSTAASA